MPPEVEQISRFHARFTFQNGHWYIADLRSRWGTYINGRKAEPEQDFLLTDGDLIRITPFTFTFSATKAQPRGLESVNDSITHDSLVRTITSDQFSQSTMMNGEVFTLLLELAAGLHAAESETALAAIALDSARRGTGLPNAALLRPLDSAGRVELIAALPPPSSTFNPVYSRSLLSRAATGVVAQISGVEDISISLMQQQVQAAICVPIMLGHTVAAYLYMDSRAASTAVRPNAAAFSLALGQLVSLSLANLKRIDIERRQAQLEAELTAAAETQRLIFPPRQGQHGPFAYIGESRPGRYVGGDFFDVVPLSNNRLAVALGDVAGKGIPASVLMTAAQGFLHAALLQTGADSTALAHAVAELNRFVCPRCPVGKFITLWVGIFDLEANTLTYLDAGHGYALLIEPNTASVQLCGDNLPLGVDDSAVYDPRTIPLPRHASALILSDGIIEQPAPPVRVGSADADRTQFDLEGVQACVQSHPDAADLPATLFEALIAHAGGPQLADDATAVHLRWE